MIDKYKISGEKIKIEENLRPRCVSLGLFLILYNCPMVVWVICV